jgi:hypothetical protein
MNFKNDFHVAYGGFGTFLSKKSIQRFMYPLDCNSYLTINETRTATAFLSPSSVIKAPSSLFEEAACRLIDRNLMYEKKVFENGMSLIELMDGRARLESYINWRNWTAGFCFHGDVFLAAFFESYNIAHNWTMDAIQGSDWKGKAHWGRKEIYGNCWNEGDGKCDPENATACHRLSPQEMDRIQNELLKLRPTEFHSPPR